jgi:hypothetical protein
MAANVDVSFLGSEACAPAARIQGFKVGGIRMDHYLDHYLDHCLDRCR